MTALDPRLKEAIDLQTQGHFDEAWALYKILEREQPGASNVVHLMGVLAGQVGNLLESVALINRAIALDPLVPDFHKNLAISYQRLGNKTKAAEIYITLGTIYANQDRLSDAIAAFEQATKIDPKNRQGFIDLGATLNRAGRYAEAKDLLGAAPQSDPNVQLNLGNAYHGLGAFEKAIAAHRRALALESGLVRAHNELAVSLLMTGQYEQGWREYEWRWQEATYTNAKLSRPMWQGESVQQLGGPLFVLSEQGHGDVIQLCRYFPLLVQAGYEVVAEIRPELLRLLSESFAGSGINLIPARFVSRGHYDDLSFAAYTGLFTMPRIFATTVETIPADIPYLAAAPARVASWAARMKADKPKIGIVWQGRPTHLHDFERSMPPELLQPLLARNDVAFFSLQKGVSQDFPSGNVTILDAALTDFAETAAAVANLDLVIGVDTAVMHLAGALGKPAWLMLAKIPDWRWMAEGETTPWYPSARLFRQPRAGDWVAVIKQVAATLDQFVNEA